MECDGLEDGAGTSAISDRYAECQESRSRHLAGCRRREPLRLFEDKGHAPAGAVQEFGTGSEKVPLLLLAEVPEVGVGAAPVALCRIAKAFEEDGAAELGDHLCGEGLR